MTRSKVAKSQVRWTFLSDSDRGLCRVVGMIVVRSAGSITSTARRMWKVSLPTPAPQHREGKPGLIDRIVIVDLLALMPGKPAKHGHHRSKDHQQTCNAEHVNQFSHPTIPPCEMFTGYIITTQALKKPRATKSI